MLYIDVHVEILHICCPSQSTCNFQYMHALQVPKMWQTLAKVVKGRRGNPVKDQLTDKSEDIFMYINVHMFTCAMYIRAMYIHTLCRRKHQTTPVLVHEELQLLSGETTRQHYEYQQALSGMCIPCTVDHR